MHIAASDTHMTQLIDHFERAIDFIDQAISKQENILVYSLAGKSSFIDENRRITAKFFQECHVVQLLLVRM
jgi:hypothetical protein